jgi:mannose-6-phosphate isomerase-like protein (cupin superfamily)
MIYLESEVRPWGVFFVLHDEFTFKKKQIEVDPGGGLSCQYHYMRTKARTIMEGTEVIKLDSQDNEYILGQKVLIPQGVKHRIENKASEKVVFIEVQTGSYFSFFGDDDIVRIEDDYNRV